MTSVNFEQTILKKVARILLTGTDKFIASLHLLKELIKSSPEDLFLCLRISVEP